MSESGDKKEINQSDPISWPSMNSIPSVNWNYVYWFNITMILIFSVAALGLSIAALVSQKSTNTQTIIMGSKEISELSVHQCDSMFLLQAQFENMQVIMPAPKNVTGCSFTFLFDKSTESVPSDISFTTPDGEFLGVSWTSATLTSSQIIGKASVLLEPVKNNQFTVISDGSNYRLLGPGIGLSNMI